MNSRRALSAAFVGLMSLWPLQTKGDAQTQQKPTVQIPQPGAADHDDGGQFRPGLVTTKATDPRIPGPPTVRSASRGCCSKSA
jgi:hypothetical protein